MRSSYVAVATPRRSPGLGSERGEIRLNVLARFGPSACLVVRLHTSAWSIGRRALHLAPRLLTQNITQRLIVNNKEEDRVLYRAQIDPHFLLQTAAPFSHAYNTCSQPTQPNFISPIELKDSFLLTRDGGSRLDQSPLRSTLRTPLHRQHMFC